MIYDNASYNLVGSKGQDLAVRPEGANHLWRKKPPRELSIDVLNGGRSYSQSANG